MALIRNPRKVGDGTNGNSTFRLADVLKGKMKMDIMDRYESLKQKVLDRKEAFDRFTQFLEKETTWLTSPASTRFHLCEGGF
jgi:hypothetical protein